MDADTINVSLAFAPKPVEPLPLWDDCLTAENYHDEEEGRAVWEAERAYERHLEDRGWEAAMLDRQMEDARGVIQFEDAIAFGATTH